MTRSSVEKRILISEDEESVSRFLVGTLAAAGYTVRAKCMGSNGVQAAIEFRPELVILDLGLPDLDGQTILLKLREWLKARILILTARESISEKIRALDNGADDYLTKPFSVAELQARIRVALRHSTRLGPSEAVHRNGPLEFHLERG